ncbi:MAG: group II truncated hemoglobin [Mariprofundaceae bacterium]|nr:group II truncated hemoglobin [Mariprofundaceae bacterium]
MMIQYSEGSASHDAVGGLLGLKKLVKDFYAFMCSNPDYAIIRDMHPQDLTVSEDKLVCFLSGWLGGERLFAKKYGAISIPQVHAHLVIHEKERDMWLSCLNEALEKQPYADHFKAYLLNQLRVPAERIRIACERRL